MLWNPDKIFNNLHFRLFQEEDEETALHQLFHRPELTREFVELLHEEARKSDREEAVSQVYQWLDRQQRAGAIQRSIVEIWRHLFPLIGTPSEPKQVSFLNSMRQTAASLMSDSVEPDALLPLTDSQQQMGSVLFHEEGQSDVPSMYDFGSQMGSLLLSDPEPLQPLGSLETQNPLGRRPGLSLTDAQLATQPDPSTPKTRPPTGSASRAPNAKVIGDPLPFIPPQTHSGTPEKAEGNDAPALHTKKRPGPRRHIYQTGNYPRIERIGVSVPVSDEEPSIHSEPPIDAIAPERRPRSGDAPSADLLKQGEPQQATPSPIDAVGLPASAEGINPRTTLPPGLKGTSPVSEEWISRESSSSADAVAPKKQEGTKPTWRPAKPKRTNTSGVVATSTQDTAPAPTSPKNTGEVDIPGVRRRRPTGQYPKIERIDVPTGTHKTIQALKERRTGQFPKIKAGLPPSAYKKDSADDLAASPSPKKVAAPQSQRPRSKETKRHTLEHGTSTLAKGASESPSGFHASPHDPSQPPPDGGPKRSKTRPPFFSPLTPVKEPAQEAFADTQDLPAFGSTEDQAIEVPQAAKSSDDPPKLPKPPKQLQIKPNATQQDATDESVATYRFSSGMYEELASDPSVEKLLEESRPPQPRVMDDTPAAPQHTESTAPPLPVVGEPALDNAATQQVDAFRPTMQAPLSEQESNELSQDTITSASDIFDDIAMEEVSDELGVISKRQTQMTSNGSQGIPIPPPSTTPPAAALEQTNNAPSYATLGEVPTVRPSQGFPPINATDPITYDEDIEIVAPQGYPTWVVMLLTAAIVAGLLFGGTYVGKMLFYKRAPQGIAQEAFPFQSKQIPVQRVYLRKKTLVLYLQKNWSKYTTADALEKQLRAFKNMPQRKTISKIALVTSGGQSIRVIELGE